MSPRVRSAVLGLLVAAVLLPAPARAGGERRGPGGEFLGVVRILEQNAGSLRLDPSALAAIRDVAEQAQRRSVELRSRRREERAALHRLLSEDPPDSAAVMRQVEVLGGLDTALLQERMRVLIELRTRLDPEQLAGLGALAVEKWRKGARRGRGSERATPPPALP